MGHIQVLTEAVANQIAAGEVVERPASCVKELVENSLDAGAKTIFVQFEEGGIRRIRVQDDGRGLDAADLQLAFARHATSKVKTARDLFRIGTLGFRGEALASIAAVARVTLQSRLEGNPDGQAVQVEGSSQVTEPRAVGMQQGTLIDVTDLFFNTPARLKYLRAVSTEQARCVEAVQRAALSRPDVRFRVEVDGRVLFQTTGSGDPLAVLAALYGPGEASQFLAVAATTADYSVRGLIGRPLQSKSNRAHAHLFINQRPIRNLSVHQAVVAGYQQRLMVNRQPLYALYLEMDPGLVDVNIHPHKSEVRFSEERDLTRVVGDAVRQALDSAFLAPTAHFSNRPRAADDAPGSARGVQSTLISGVANRQSFATRTETGVARSAKPRSNESSVPVARETLETIYRDVSGKTESASLQTESGVPLPIEAAPRRDAQWVLRPIGQALGMYILADDGHDLYIIDQHAAHERVLYERFTKRMQAAEHSSTPLLTPLPLNLTAAEADLVGQQQALLTELGLEVEPFGGNSFLLRTIPDVWDGLDVDCLIHELLDALAEDVRQVDVQSAVRERIVMRACKAAIKANHRLSEMEMRALCEAFSALDDPFHCPHGRPVLIRMSSRQLEKEFRRIV